MENTQVGNVVLYESAPKQAREFSRGRIILALFAVAVTAVCIGMFASGHLGLHAGSLLALLSLTGLVGVNAVTYESPVAGVTAPTATQARTHQSLNCTVNGDGAATTVVITHNWGLSAAELAAGWPMVNTEALLASGYTAAPLVTTKAANSVTLTVTAFAGVGLRVALQRPFSMLK